ncbi:hypothetical protein N0V88_004901 [Collariella sp. IMI 366227]|nr:hypothetical protein N0V88_004901 [Collariella sp. IMI 366227]
MSTPSNLPSDLCSFASLSLEAWEANAGYWNSSITKHGNKYWQRLQEPSLTCLLGSHLSKPGGCKALDLATVTGDCEVIRTKIVKDYMHVAPAMGIAVPGQPKKQPYFHRPMHELFTTFFKGGLVMDAMEELAFTEEDAEDRIESSSNYTQLPAILAFRMRLP